MRVNNLFNSYNIMLVKHSAKKSMINLTKSKPKLSKKTSITEKPKKPTAKKHKATTTGITAPRTCLDSPIHFQSRRASIRFTSCETHQTLPQYKPLKSFKRCLSKEKCIPKKPKLNSKGQKIEKMLLSPIKKIRLDFLNQEDQSMMKFLEIL